MVRVYSARNPWTPAAVRDCFLPRMRFTSPTQVSESRSVAASSLLLGFSMAYSTRSQSINVRGFAAGGKSVRLGAGQNGLKPQAGAFLLMIGPTYGLIPA